MILHLSSTWKGRHRVNSQVLICPLSPLFVNVFRCRFGCSKSVCANKSWGEDLGQPQDFDVCVCMYVVCTTTSTSIHTHVYIYIYVYMYVCVSQLTLKAIPTHRAVI